MDVAKLRALIGSWVFEGGGIAQSCGIGIAPVNRAETYERWRTLSMMPGAEAKEATAGWISSGLESVAR